MEASFKSYPDIFPKSWNTGILRDLEAEIESLGTRARSYLEDRVIAKQKIDDFRRCFLKMGFVLIELPLLKEFTKSTMYSVLESCLDSDWGYSFLFDLGLSLQKGDESAGDDENQVGQLIIEEFCHFKEVRTMVWNEETCQSLQRIQFVILEQLSIHLLLATNWRSIKLSS
jgi:hypothetical protein